MASEGMQSERDSSEMDGMSSLGASSEMDGMSSLGASSEMDDMSSLEASSEMDDMSSLGTSSHTLSASPEPRPRYPGNAPAEPGSSSSTSYHHDIPPYEEVPASFIPADWPAGPRELDPGHFICPFMGCRRATGHRSSGRGYTQETLPDHLLIAHGGPDGFQSLAGELRLRVRFLRQALRHLRWALDENDENAEHQSGRGVDRGDPDGDLQQQERAVIADLEEIAAWERSWRHLRPSGRAAAAAEEAPRRPRRARESVRSRSMSPSPSIERAAEAALAAAEDSLYRERDPIWPRSVSASIERAADAAIAAAEYSLYRERDPVRAPSISPRMAPRESLEYPYTGPSRTRTRYGTHPRGDARAAHETSRTNVTQWRVTLYGAFGPVVMIMDSSGPPTAMITPAESEYP